MAGSSIDRRSFLVGALGGVALGGGAGFASGSMFQPPPKSLPGVRSFAQQGEDLIVAEMFRGPLRVPRPTYVDIGAHDPVIDSNTYYFYARGARGLLVEPNPTYAAKLRKERPGDDVLEAGIGPTEEDVFADYYVVRGDGENNTFSKEQADAIVRQSGAQVIERVTKVMLMNVNQALAAHFANRAPDFLSIDTEGLDLAILRSLDFGRFRPRVVCAETCKMDGSVEEAIMELMKGHGYVVRGGTFVNTVFVDEQLLSAARVPGQPQRADGTVGH
jgi:FkbM family methyltransferase